jgi:hypothetical protein
MFEIKLKGEKVMSKNLKKISTNKGRQVKSQTYAISQVIAGLLYVHLLLDERKRNQCDKTTDSIKRARLDIDLLFARSIADSFGSNAVKVLFEKAEKAKFPISESVRNLDFYSRYPEEHPKFYMNELRSKVRSILSDYHLL